MNTDDLHLRSPASHPILLTSESELAHIRERLSEPAYRALYDAVCEIALSYPADVTSPQAAPADVDPRHFDIGWQLMGMERVLPAAGVAWRISGDREYLRHASVLLHTAARWTEWSDGRHAVMDGYRSVAPETASGMRAFAWALDFFHGSLPEDTKCRVCKMLAFHAQRLTEISAQGKVRWAAQPSDDWSADMHSAIGHAALALYGTDDRAEIWLRQALDRIIAYLDSLPSDGGHPSGITRWEYALTRCCMFIEALYRFTGYDIRRHPAIERTRRFAVRCLTPGANHIVQLDQALPLHISNPAGGPLSKLLAKWFGDPVIGWAISNTPKLTYVQAQDLLWFDDSIPRESPADAGEGSAAFTDIGWTIMRSGWAARDAMVTFKCTPYQPGYHHLDQGTFEVFADGREVVVDSGLGWRAHPNYFDRYRDSLAHNVILVDGKGQLRHTPESHGEMKHVELSSDADYSVGECSGAYENVEVFTRAVLFLKPDVIVIRDTIRLDQPRSVEWLLHGGGDFEIIIHAEDRGFKVASGDKAIEGFVLEPAKWRYSIRRGYKLADWDTRHEVTHPVMAILPDKTASVDFMVVLKIGDADTPRAFPGKAGPNGMLQLTVGRKKWRVKPSEDGLAYQRAPSRARRSSG